MSVSNDSERGARRSPTGALLAGLDRVLGALCRLGTVLGAVLVLLTTAVVGYGVVMRYLLGQPQVWTDEMVAFWLVAIVLLGAADVLRRGGHICIDLVTDRVSARARGWIDLWGLLSVIALSVVMVHSGWNMVAFSRMVELLSEGYLEAPLWIPQSMVPFGFALMGLAALHRLVVRLRERDAGA